MTPRPDDDALRWDGDDDPTLDDGRADDEPAAAHTPAAVPETASPALPDGFTAVGKDSQTVGHLAADGTITPPVEREPLGNVALIALGVLGGVYALYVIGWIVGGLRLQGVAPSLVSDVMFLGSTWLAVLAPVIWFATTWLLTRRSRLWLRFVWLVAGALLLVPWPFVMVGVVGS